MRVISKEKLKIFWEAHPDVKASLEAWYKEAEHACWNSPEEIKRRYPSSDPITGNRMVFNIKGNSYRLVVKIHYNTGIIYIRFIGTHAQYDRIDVEKV